MDESVLMMIRGIGVTRGGGFRNIHALQKAWEKTLQRQTERIYREEREGKRPDCLLVTKEDLIGPDPTVQYRKSPAWAQLKAMVGVAIVVTLVAELSNNSGQDRCVILLGYEEQMLEMFRKSNPGLARRFALADAFHFTNYTVEQLGQILDMKLRGQCLRITDEARAVAMEVLERASERPTFGNSGDVENLISHAKDAYEKRNPTNPLCEPETNMVLMPEDFDVEYKRHEQAAENCVSRFEDLVGVDEIIAQLQEYQAAVAGMRRVGIDPRPYTPFTFVFRGPPGTGKTSTARTMGHIYYDMGFLSAPDVVECSVSDLIPSFGETGKSVVGLMERALGKVLFIDEAYRLASGEKGRQAVEELVDALTKPRYAQNLIVVLAGYDNDMARLMQVNRGLRSRFATDIVFHPLSPRDSWGLLQRELESVGFCIQAEGEDIHTVMDLFSRLREKKAWANGRDVKRLASVLIRCIINEGNMDHDRQVSVGAIVRHLEMAESR